jgi:hypothetical protein
MWLVSSTMLYLDISCNKRTPSSVNGPGSEVPQ